MIILVSKDFLPFAQALQERYDEPIVNFWDHPNWLHDLVSENDGKPISRLSIIGHGDSIYGEDQAFFGGNIQERVMLIEDFAHLLITLLKYNERLKPGFCRHLHQIDIIDCHIGERKFIAQIVAEYMQADPYLGEHATHIKLNGFVSPHHPKSGSILMPSQDNNQSLSFYTFDSTHAYQQYQTIHEKVEELKLTLHNLAHMPGHTKLLSNGQSRSEATTQLQKQYDTLLIKEQKLLKQHTQKAKHITDPRQYFSKHPECQITVADRSHDPKKKIHVQKLFSPKHAATQPQVPHREHHKHTSYLEGSMFKHPHQHIIEEEVTKRLHSHHTTHHKKHR